MVGPDDRGWMVKLACDRGDGDGVGSWWGKRKGRGRREPRSREKDAREEGGERVGLEGEKGCGGVMKLGTQRRGVCS